MLRSADRFRAVGVSGAETFVVGGAIVCGQSPRGRTCRGPCLDRNQRRRLRLGTEFAAVVVLAATLPGRDALKCAYAQATSGHAQLRNLSATSLPLQNSVSPNTMCAAWFRRARSVPYALEPWIRGIYAPATRAGAVSPCAGRARCSTGF